MGYLTGLILLPIAAVLAIWLSARRAGGSWLVLVGAGLGPVVLLQSEVYGAEARECADVAARGCDRGALLPVFWFGVALIAVGIVIGAVSLARGRARGRLVSSPLPEH